MFVFYDNSWHKFIYLPLRTRVCVLLHWLFNDRLPLVLSLSLSLSVSLSLI